MRTHKLRRISIYRGATNCSASSLFFHCVAVAVHFVRWQHKLAQTARYFIVLLNFHRKKKRRFQINLMDLSCLVFITIPIFFFRLFTLFCRSFVMDSNSGCMCLRFSICISISYLLSSANVNTKIFITSSQFIDIFFFSHSTLMPTKTKPIEHRNDTDENKEKEKKNLTKKITRSICCSWIQNKPIKCIKKKKIQWNTIYSSENERKKKTTTTISTPNLQLKVGDERRKKYVKKVCIQNK